MEDDQDLIIILEEIDQHQKSSTYGKPFHVMTSVKGKPLDKSVVNSETTSNSDGSQLSKPSTGDEHLSVLMEQGNTMVALLQSSVDEQKKETDKR